VTEATRVHSEIANQPYPKKWIVEGQAERDVETWQRASHAAAEIARRAVAEIEAELELARYGFFLRDDTELRKGDPMFEGHEEAYSVCSLPFERHAVLAGSRQWAARIALERARSGEINRSACAIEAENTGLREAATAALARFKFIQAMSADIAEKTGFDCGCEENDELIQQLEAALEQTK
jgi:hypothetical protein